MAAVTSSKPPCASAPAAAGPETAHSTHANHACEPHTGNATECHRRVPNAPNFKADRSAGVTTARPAMAPPWLPASWQGHACCRFPDRRCTECPRPARTGLRLSGARPRNRWFAPQCSSARRHPDRRRTRPGAGGPPAVRHRGKMPNRRCIDTQDRTGHPGPVSTSRPEICPCRWHSDSTRGRRRHPKAILCCRTRRRRRSRRLSCNWHRRHSRPQHI